LSSAPHIGERLVDALDLSLLQDALSGSVFAGKVQHFAEIPSTNTYAMQAAIGGAPHGSVYVADAQTAGRGRGGHHWASPAGSGLYVSVLLRPALAPADALWLSLAAGISAIDAVTDAAGFTPDLRWPNDLMAGHRKLGGILTEMQAEATRVRFVVIGIGINVHQAAFPEELAAHATSLAIELPGARVKRTAVLVDLLRHLEREASALAGTEPQAAHRSLVQRIESRSSWVRGKQVIVGEDVPFEGITEGLDARGFLRVRTSSGALRTVLSGGVRERE
jgi:BirA family biotin operon repressor/biotin-[acetyl-CoA-carboxylase] ligase